MTKTTKEISDYGTNEIHRRLTIIVPKFSGRSAKVMDEQEIDRLLLRGWITQQQHSALEGFMRRLHKASFVGVKSPSYEAPMSADPSLISEKKAKAVRNIVGLFNTLDIHMGYENRNRLVNLVLSDHEWPSTKENLQKTIKILEDVITGRLTNDHKQS